MTRDELLRLSDGCAKRATAIELRPDGRALVGAIEALRLAVLAASEPVEVVAAEDPGRWCRVELFGHSVVHGLVREVEAYGRRWLEVTQPRLVSFDGCEEQEVAREHVKRYHPNAVYGMEEADEATVMGHLRRSRGLFRWQDGTWRTELEPVELVDREALAARDERLRGEDDADDIPF